MGEGAGIRALFFDVGETLLDESRLWSAWADWLGAPRPVLYALLGAAIERGDHHLEPLRTLRPGFDLQRERAAREVAGVVDLPEPEDLYPDVRPCFEALREQGFVVGVAGNQPSTHPDLWRALALPIDIVTSSADLGMEKPDPSFFAALAHLVGARPQECAYVGDRLDNDVLPSAQAGLLAVFIRRGPWGFIHARWPQAERADLRIESLSELPAVLAGRRM